MTCVVCGEDMAPGPHHDSEGRVFSPLTRRWEHTVNAHTKCLEATPTPPGGEKREDAMTDEQKMRQLKDKILEVWYPDETTGTHLPVSDYVRGLAVLAAGFILQREAPLQAEVERLRAIEQAAHEYLYATDEEIDAKADVLGAALEKKATT